MTKLNPKQLLARTRAEARKGARFVRIGGSEVLWVLLAPLSVVSACNKYVSDDNPIVTLAPCSEGQNRPCGSGMGACKDARQSCENGEWGVCLPAPSQERCDHEDNNCDGEVDEGYFVGLQCQLPNGCFGRYECAEDNSVSSCVIDRLAYDGGVCLGGNSASADSGRTCLPHPIDLSEFGPAGVVQGGGASAPTCELASSGKLTLEYSISTCVMPEPFRGCVVARHQNVKEFMQGHGVFEVEICVEGTLDGAANIWFQDSRYISAGHVPEGRLPLSLVAKGEPFSSSCRRRWFGMEDIDYPKACSCPSDPNSKGSLLDASSGSSSLDGGTTFSFEDSDIQLVSEWCQPTMSASASAQVSIVLTSLKYIPRECLCRIDADCGAGVCHMEFWPEGACCRCDSSCLGVCY